MYLVIGATGQVGSSVINELTDRNIEFVGTYYSTPKNGCVKLDITDEQQVSDIFSIINPDVVINCAAYTNVDKAEEEQDKCYDTNCDALKYICKQCIIHDSKLIHISTDYVYGNKSEDTLDEYQQVMLPMNTYGNSKLLGDIIVQSYMKKYYIVRTSWVYGNGNNFVKTMLKLSENKEEVSVVSDQIGRPTNSDTIAHAVVEMSLTDKYGVYNVTDSGDYTSWNEFCNEIYSIKNKSTRVKNISTEDYDRLANIQPNSRLNISKFEREFYKLPEWKNSLKKYLDNCNF